MLFGLSGGEMIEAELKGWLKKLDAMQKEYDRLRAENKEFRKIIKALNKMVSHYRIGKSRMPEWVFDTLAKAKAKYGDLSKMPKEEG